MDSKRTFYCDTHVSSFEEVKIIDILGFIVFFVKVKEISGYKRNAGLEITCSKYQRRKEMFLLSRQLKSTYILCCLFRLFYSTKRRIQKSIDVWDFS